jgi:prepilin-type N-terminal cleavage/methylation domain-containing protein
MTAKLGNVAARIVAAGIVAAGFVVERIVAWPGSKHAPRARQAGLTLIELLVALLLMALLATLGWRGLDAVARSSVQVLSLAEQTQMIHQTLSQLEVDLMEAAQLRRNGLFALEMTSPLAQDGWRSSGQSLSASSAVFQTAAQPQDASWILFRRAIPETPTLTPLRWVRWQVRGGRLQRVLSVEPLSAETIAALDPSGGAPGVQVQVLLEGVRAMELRPIVPMNEAEALQRTERWSGVEVVLVQIDGRRLRRILSLRD